MICDIDNTSNPKDKYIEMVFDAVKFNKTKRKKIMPSDMSLILPIEYHSNKRDKCKYSFFVGQREYKLFENQSETFMIQDYIETCLNSAMTYCTLLNIQSLDLHYCEVILQMMCRISRINGMDHIIYHKTGKKIFGDTIKFKKIDLQLVVPECVLYVDGIFYFHTRLINRIMESYMCDVNIEYSDELRVDKNKPGTNCLFDNVITDGKTLNSVQTRKLITLLVIADHMCCHLFEGPCTDYIYHENFAQQYMTLHSKLLIKQQGTSNNFLRMSDINMLNI
jgi:hypothetical protein